MLAASDTTARQALMTDDDEILDEEILRKVELGFPCLLINVVSTILGIDWSKPSILRQVFFCFRLQLLIMFIICLLCIIFGATNMNTYCNPKMLPIVLVVQGSCGLFIVMVYFCSILCGDVSKDTWRRSESEYEIVRLIFAFTHILILFCFIWFFIGHIWVFGIRSYCEYSTLRGFSFAIVLIQYVLGFWFIICYICNHPLLLRWFGNKIEDRLNEFDSAQQRPSNTSGLRSQKSNEPNNIQNRILFQI